jgi:transposase
MCGRIADAFAADAKAMAQVKSGLLLLAFCWAHVRRDFVGLGKSWSELTPWAVA